MSSGVDSETLSFDIYARHDDRHFLVSGEIEGLAADVTARVREIADRLGAHGIVYNFEIDEIGHPANSFVIRHPAFGD